MPPSRAWPGGWRPTEPGNCFLPPTPGTSQSELFPFALQPLGRGPQVRLPARRSGLSFQASWPSPRGTPLPSDVVVPGVDGAQPSRDFDLYLPSTPGDIKIREIMGGGEEKNNTKFLCTLWIATPLCRASGSSDPNVPCTYSRWPLSCCSPDSDPEKGVSCLNAAFPFGLPGFYATLCSSCAVLCHCCLFKNKFCDLHQRGLGMENLQKECKQHKKSQMKSAETPLTAKSGLRCVRCTPDLCFMSLACVVSTFHPYTHSSFMDGVLTRSVTLHLVLGP